jgi:dTDP-4-dehydrorhamnose reductase
MKRERILVLGASGFIGRAFYSYFKKQGKLVIGTYCDNSINISKEDGVYINLNNANFRQLENVEKFDYVIMCHGITDIDKCITKRSYIINVENTIKFLSYLKHKNTGIIPIFFSTSMVYSGKRRYPREISKTFPINDYGKQKLAVERYLTDNFRKTIILRLTKVFGVDKNDGTLFTKWMNCFMRKQQINAASDYFISPIYIEDVVKAAVQLMKNGHYGIYNLGGDAVASYFDFAKQFISFFGINSSLLCSVSVKDLEIRQKRPKLNSVDTSRLMKTIKFNLTPIDECFRIIKYNYNFN